MVRPVYCTSCGSILKGDEYKTFICKVCEKKQSSKVNTSFTYPSVEFIYKIILK